MQTPLTLYAYKAVDMKDKDVLYRGTLPGTSTKPNTREILTYVTGAHCEHVLERVAQARVDRQAVGSRRSAC